MDRESHDELTGTQRRVLNFIVGRIESTQQWPTFLEISEEFGWSSPNSAADHVHALERKGWVGRLAGQRSRRYRLARHSVEVRELAGRILIDCGLRPRRGLPARTSSCPLSMISRSCAPLYV